MRSAGKFAPKRGIDCGDCPEDARPAIVVLGYYGCSNLCSLVLHGVRQGIDDAALRPGRDIEVQAWYQGGISVMDFTDADHPFEIAYFDRGPIDPKMLILGGDWSAYWYNGHIYASEIARGLDIFELSPTEFLTQY